jgi:hypothetical protein
MKCNKARKFYQCRWPKPIKTSACWPHHLAKHPRTLVSCRGRLGTHIDLVILLPVAEDRGRHDFSQVWTAQREARTQRGRQPWLISRRVGKVDDFEYSMHVSQVQVEKYAERSLMHDRAG